MKLVMPFGKNDIRLKLQSCVAVFFIFLYIGGTISTDLIHHILHEHHEEYLHSYEQENDACHQAVVHHNKDAGCKHKAHISKTETCKHGHVVFHGDQLVISNVFKKITFENYFLVEHFLSVPLTGNTFQPSLRGPPTA